MLAMLARVGRTLAVGAGEALWDDSGTTLGTTWGRLWDDSGTTLRLQAARDPKDGSLER